MFGVVVEAVESGGGGSGLQSRGLCPAAAPRAEHG